MLRGIHWSVVLLAFAVMGCAQKTPPVPDRGGEITEASYGMLFVALNVADLERSLDFYTRVLGMIETGRYPEGEDGVGVALKFTEREEEPHLLLAYRGPRDAPYDLGDGLSRVALLVPDIALLVSRVADAGFDVVRPPVELPEYRVSVAFVVDPDGYLVELIERH